MLEAFLLKRRGCCAAAKWRDGKRARPTWPTAMRPNSMIASEFKHRPHPEHDRVADRVGATRVPWIGHMAARMDDVLKIGLQEPVVRQLHLIAELDDRLIIADRHRLPGQVHHIAVECRGPW